MLAASIMLIGFYSRSTSIVHQEQFEVAHVKHIVPAESKALELERQMYSHLRPSHLPSRYTTSSNLVIERETVDFFELRQKKKPGPSVCHDFASISPKTRTSNAVCASQATARSLGIYSEGETTMLR